MANPPTSWEMIRGAASGDAGQRAAFVRHYEPVIRRYLGARWEGNLLAGSIDDAAQEVLLACFRDHGVLERADPSRPGGFRAFFYGVIRKVAQRFEREQAGRREVQAASEGDMEAVDDDAPGLSTVFDRAWALGLLGEAVERHRLAAESGGGEARRRVDLLRLRFQEGMPIREIASLWAMDPARVHKEYARAREEYRRALLDVVAALHPGAPDEVAGEAARLLSLFR